MKSLKEIRKRQLECMKVVLDICPKKCVENSPPGLWCWMCTLAKEQEEILAWASGEESLFKKAINELLAKMRA